MLRQLHDLHIKMWSNEQIKMRESKFGPALVVESSSSSGGYVLGFRLDPVSKLQAVTRELTSLYQIHSHQPEFGVQYSLNVQVKLLSHNSKLWNAVQDYNVFLKIILYLSYVQRTKVL